MNRFGGHHRAPLQAYVVEPELDVINTVRMQYKRIRLIVLLLRRSFFRSYQRRFTMTSVEKPGMSDAAPSFPWNVATQLTVQCKLAAQPIQPVNLLIQPGNVLRYSTAPTWTLTVETYDFTTGNEKLEAEWAPGVNLKSGALSHVQFIGWKYGGYQILFTPSGNAATEVDLNLWLWAGQGATNTDYSGGFSFSFMNYNWQQGDNTSCYVQVSNDDSSEYSGTIDSQTQTVAVSWKVS